jgi:hypothetical protein
VFVFLTKFELRHLFAHRSCSAMRHLVPLALGGLAAAATATTTSLPGTKYDNSTVWEPLDLFSNTPPAAAARRHVSPPPPPPIARRDAADDSWNPPANLAAPLDELWKHVEEVTPDLYTMSNSGWDQIMATNGTISYCMRWESESPLTREVRDTIERVLPEQYNKWFRWMYGWDGFPFDRIDVRVVAYAAKGSVDVQGDMGGRDLYVDLLDHEGVPMCPDDCSRWHHRDNKFPNCTGGADHHFDQTFWLTDGMTSGSGWDWGQRIGKEYFFNDVARKTDNITILQHEMGHTFALDDCEAPISVVLSLLMFWLVADPMCAL